MGYSPGGRPGGMFGQHPNRARIIQGVRKALHDVGYDSVVFFWDDEQGNFRVEARDRHGRSVRGSLDCPEV